MLKLNWIETSLIAFAKRYPRYDKWDELLETVRPEVAQIIRDKINERL